MPKFPYDAMVAMLTQSAAAFDDHYAFRQDSCSTSQKDYDWQIRFETARLHCPAVEYLQAARARRMGDERVAKSIRTIRR